MNKLKSIDKIHSTQCNMFKKILYFTIEVTLYVKEMNYHYLEIVLNTHSQHILNMFFLYFLFCEWKVNFEWNIEDKMKKH